jgi:hypothetical protein
MQGFTVSRDGQQIGQAESTEQLIRLAKDYHERGQTGQYSIECAGQEWGKLTIAETWRIDGNHGLLITQDTVVIDH